MAQPCTLTRSSSCGERPFGAFCSAQNRKRSDSFTITSVRMGTWSPKCPGGERTSPGRGEEDGEQWTALARGLRAAFFRCSDVSIDHPAGDCLARCDYLPLRDELFARGQWKAQCYTRTLLLQGDAFNVQLLCWAPGCSSPVHGHSCAVENTPSNCFLMVLEGSLTETVYPQEAVLADGKSIDSRAGRSRVLVAGDVGYINDTMGLHKVGNPNGARAVSLHVYAPGWVRPPLFAEIFPEVDAGGAEYDAPFGDF